LESKERPSLSNALAHRSEQIDVKNSDDAMPFEKDTTTMIKFENSEKWLPFQSVEKQIYAIFENIRLIVKNPNF
jgi:hypothetical protein